MPLNASLDAALKGAAPTVCCLLEIKLPGHTIRALDGSGEIVFGGEVYRNEDATFGTLDAIEDVTEQVGTEAPTLRFTFLPSSNAALAAITAPANQCSEVSLWFGAVNPATGELIGDPELLFLGELDEVPVDFGQNATIITFDVVSAWERLFEVNEGARLNNSFWQSLYPGDRGLEFVTAIQRQEPWGTDAPRPNVVADTTTGGGGYGGGIGGGGGERSWYL